MSDGQAADGRTDAVILAGGTIRDPEFRDGVGVDRRPLMPILGKPMVQWVVEALRASRNIGRIVVLSPPDLQDTEVPQMVDAVVDEGVDEVDNLYRGLDALPGARQVLLVSSDLALLLPEAVDDLIDNAPPDANVVFPVLEKGSLNPELEAHGWVFVKCPDGQFTGASCFLFEPQAIIDRRAWIQRVFDARRSVFKLICMWGLVFSVRAFLRRATLAEAEARLSEVVGVHGRAYRTPFAELVMDVDRLHDVPLVEERLRQRSSA